MKCIRLQDLGQKDGDLYLFSGELYYLTQCSLANEVIGISTIQLVYFSMLLLSSVSRLIGRCLVFGRLKSGCLRLGYSPRLRHG